MAVFYLWPTMPRCHYCHNCDAADCATYRTNLEYHVKLAQAWRKVVAQHFCKIGLGLGTIFCDDHERNIVFRVLWHSMSLLPKGLNSGCSWNPGVKKRLHFTPIQTPTRQICCDPDAIKIIVPAESCSPPTNYLEINEPDLIMPDTHKEFLTNMPQWEKIIWKMKSLQP